MQGPNTGIEAEAERAVAESPFPSVVVDVDSARILAASPSASAVLDAAGGDVVGARFEDYTADAPVGVRDVFASGQVTGYEAVRVLARPGAGIPARVWVQPFDRGAPNECVLVTLALDDAAEPAPEGRSDVETDAVAPVAGTTDETLLVVQLSSDATAMFGVVAADLLGRSLLSLLAPRDRATALMALAEAAETGRGTTVCVDAYHYGAVSGRPALPCELLVVPMSPTPSCFFVLLPIAAQSPRARMSEQLSGILTRLMPDIDTSTGVPRFAGGAGRDSSAGDELTAREREVLSLLLRGERTPAIARALFLSQSTVRTHVAAIERKLGASNQQQVIDMFLDRRSPSSRW